MKFELDYHHLLKSPINGVDKPFPAHERINQIVEEIKLADQVGLDIYGLGSTIEKIMQYQIQLQY